MLFLVDDIDMFVVPHCQALSAWQCGTTRSDLGGTASLQTSLVIRSGPRRNHLEGIVSLQAWLVTNMVEQEKRQTDLNPARAAALHRIAQSLARTSDTGSFLHQALGELSVLLQLTF